MDYNTKDFSQFPFKIHEEFGLLLQDMESNSPNPSRRRPKVPWRAKASNNYLTKAMRFQNSQPDYSEHKISGEHLRKASELKKLVERLIFHLPNSCEWNIRAAGLQHSRRVSSSGGEYLPKRSYQSGFPRSAS